MDRRAFVIDTGNGQLVPLEGEAENSAKLPPLVDSLEDKEATWDKVGRRIDITIEENRANFVKVIWTKTKDGEPDQISLELVAPIDSSAVKQLRVENAARMLMVSGVPPNTILHVAKHRFPGLSGTVENPITLEDFIQHANKLHEPKGTSLQPQHPSPNTTQRKRDLVELLPTGNTGTELPVGTQEQPENGQTGKRAEETNTPQKEHGEKGTMPAPTTKSEPFTTYDRNRNPVPQIKQVHKINKAA